MWHSRRTAPLRNWLQAARGVCRRVGVEAFEELVRIHGSRMRDKGARRLDHLEVDVRHVAETRAWVIRVAAALRDQRAGINVLPVLRVELAHVAVKERNRIALVVFEHIRDDDGSPALREAWDGPVGDLIRS